MAHQQASLTSNHPGLGSPGTLVTIDDVEGHHATTASANAAASFACADCGVSVMAVITDTAKVGRKTVAKRDYIVVSCLHLCVEVAMPRTVETGVFQLAGRASVSEAEPRSSGV